MYKNPAIKKAIGVLMLGIFIFSATPKQWLHDIVTNHKDARAASFDGKQSLSVAGYHCDCENLVVQVPFINYDLAVELNTPEFSIQHHSATISNFISTYHLFSSLRGPPSRA